MARTLLLVDLTNIAARCSMGGPVPPAVAADTACNMIARLAGALDASHLVTCVDSPGETWRKQRVPTYKAGRSFDTKPYSKAAQEAAQRRGWCVLAASGWEADDLIATVVARGGEAFDTVIYSGDSDLLALVRAGTDLRGAVTVAWPLNGGSWALRTPADVREEWGVLDPALLPQLKALAGEDGDNIESVWGRTPKGRVSVQTKKAQQLLAAFGDIEGVIAAGGMNATRDARVVCLGAERVRLALELTTLCTDVPLPPLRPSAIALPSRAREVAYA